MEYGVMAVTRRLPKLQHSITPLLGADPLAKPREDNSLPPTCTILRIAAFLVIPKDWDTSRSPKPGSASRITECRRCWFSTWLTGCCTRHTSITLPHSGRFAVASNIFAVPLSVQALASTIFGLYTGLVYLTPIAGGIIADRFLGRTRTIIIGALLMSAGHFLMAFDVTFLLALTCLLCGVGCFKGNLASQVGATLCARG